SLREPAARCRTTSRCSRRWPTRPRWRSTKRGCSARPRRGARCSSGFPTRPSRCRARGSAVIGSQPSSARRATSWASTAATSSPWPAEEGAPEPVRPGDDAGPAGLRLPVTEAAGPYHEALRSRRPIAVLSDADLARVLPLDPAHLDRPYLRSRRFVVAPLVAGDRVIGVVSADNKPSRRPISPRSLEPFSSLCQNLAMALEESRLYAEARAREAETTRLYASAKTLSDGLALLNQASRALHRTLDVDAMLDDALNELAKAFAAGGALLHLLADDGTLSRSVGHWVTTGPRPGEPGRLGALSEHVRRTRAPVLLRDVTRHPELVHPANLAHGVQSIAAYPIVGQHERVLGVLVLYYTTAQAFGETETRLLASYADQLATALENAGLYEETQTQRVRLAQIFNSTSDGILLVSREGEIQAANRRAGELLGFDASAVIGVRLSELASGRRAASE